jgi:phage terminase large subunit
MGPSPQTAELADILRDVQSRANPLDAFNSIVLQRAAYWRSQRDIARALMDPEIRTVVVPAGHSVGKSYFAGGAILGWLTLLADSMVVSTGPSHFQLDKVLWKEIRKARAGSPLLRGLGKLTRSPNILEYEEGWSALGISTTEPERLQGLHPKGPLLVVVDEASGVNDPDIWEGLDSLKPVKKLLISNPLRAMGKFYEVCRQAEDDPTIRLIRIPSTDSPDIGLPVSPRGLADATWLRDMRLDYGKDSQTWRVRVAALFPEGAADLLVPPSWLDACQAAPHVPAGPRRMAIDLGLGNGGDLTVLLVRDDNGVHHVEADNRWSLEAAAERAARLAERFGVEPVRITWDFEGLGAGFGRELSLQGLHGCVPYRGQALSRNVKYDRARTAVHMLLRQRLNPATRDDWGRPLPQFSVPRALCERLRGELRELTHHPDSSGRSVLRTKDLVRAALGRSPDFTDTLAQSFFLDLQQIHIAGSNARPRPVRATAVPA